MKIINILLFALLAVLLIGFLAGCSKSNKETTSIDLETNVGNDKGQIAPDFEVQLSDGGTFKLSDYRGEKPVLIEFWATWCPYCKRDFNTVKNVYPDYKDDVVFLAIDLDGSENAEAINEYVDKYDLDDIKFALTKASVLTDYSTRTTTTKYAISRNGTILWKGSGAVDADTWNIILTGLKES